MWNCVFRNITKSFVHNSMLLANHKTEAYRDLKIFLRSRFLRFFSNRKTRFSKLLNLLRFSWSVVSCWQDENDLYWIYFNLKTLFGQKQRKSDCPNISIARISIVRKSWLLENWLSGNFFGFLKSSELPKKGISKIKSIPIFNMINNIFVEKNFNQLRLLGTNIFF